MSDSFGPIVTSVDVERAIENTLRKWSSTYIRKLEEHSGREQHACENIKSWRAANTIDERFNEQMIPAVQIMMTNKVKVITKGQDDDAMFSGEIDILVQSNEAEPARELAALYAYFHGLILHQHPLLDGSIPVTGLGWEEYDTPAIGKAKERWLGLGSVVVNLGVARVANSLMGPLEPVEEMPAPEYPPVRTLRTILDAETAGGNDKD